MVSRRKGPLRAWRIADGRFPIFSGAGARDHGGRWNSPGTEVIYASASFSCAMLEQLARAGIGHLPKGQVWIEINAPAILIEVVEPEDNLGWDREDRLASQAYGDQWIREQRTAVLVVPSVAANGLEKNVIINPAHKDFGKITCTEPKSMEWNQRFLVPPLITEEKK